MSARDWDSEIGRDIIRAHKKLDGALLPILHALQEHFGYVDPASVPVIADELNLSRAEVHGVITFYHDFRDHAPGRHVVKICRAEACQSMGGRANEERAKQRLNTDFHETSPDGRYTLEPIYCFGNCACAPAAMIDGKLHGRVTPQRFDQLIDKLEAKR
ncbi:MAG TPA: formate dehydrogenase subunit gamma [Dongiaceae bacterium]|nr:formate dehydrogenase subunit gamma [Dongiaceae bacterium]